MRRGFRVPNEEGVQGEWAQDEGDSPSIVGGMEALTLCSHAAHLLIHLSAESGLSLGARVCARAPVGAAEDGRLHHGRVVRPTTDRGTIQFRGMRQFEIAGDISAAVVPGFTHLAHDIIFF